MKKVFVKWNLKVHGGLKKILGAGCALLIDPHGAVITKCKHIGGPPETTVADYSVSFSDMLNFAVDVLLEKGYLNIYED